MRKMTIESRKKLHGFLFILPWLIGLCVFWLYPVIMSLVMSFFQLRSNADQYVWTWLGTGNYTRILINDTAFMDQLTPYILRTVVSTPIIVVFAIIVALLLNQKFYGRGLLRAVFFMPVLFTTGGVLLTIMTNDGTGVNTANTATMNASTTTGTVSFMANPALTAAITAALPAQLATALKEMLSSFILILWYSGIQITLLLAGCQSIPGSIYEAATIDGANGWERLWKITLPGIFPYILICMIFTLVDQCTAPNNPLMKLINEATNVNLGTQGIGYATTLAWIFQAIMLVLIGLIFLLFRNATPGKSR